MTTSNTPAPTGSNLVQYAEPTIEDLDAEQEAFEEAAEENDFLKLKDGRNALRFLPPEVGQKTHILTVFEHFIERGKRKVRFACPKAAIKDKKPCPACDESQRLKRTGNPADREESWQLKAKARYYANVINRADEEAGVKVLGFGKGVYDELRAILQDGGNYTNPTDVGFDIIIRKSGQALGTEYKVNPSMNKSPLAQDPVKINAILADRFDLAEFIEAMPFEEIERLVNSTGDEDNGKGKKRGDRKQGAAKGRNVQDDFDDTKEAKDAEWSEDEKEA